MFSKWFKDIKGLWQKVIIPDEEVEILRIQSIADDIMLYKKVLSMVKEDFGNLHPLSQERIALAVYSQKSDKFYTEILSILEEKTEAIKNSERGDKP